MANIYSERQSNAVKRENKVLSMETRLAAPPSDISQLEWPRYSRFVLTLIDKSGKDTVYPFANIPAQDMFDIEQNVRVANVINSLYPFLSPNAGASTAKTGAAALTNATFVFGTHKGKTVTDVVREKPDCKEELIQQRGFLAQNAEKFPNNNNIINDIDIILKQMEEGTLDMSSAPPSFPVSKTIYSQPYKPLESRVDSEGRYLIYNIEITCNFNMRYPWEITIKNGYAPTSVAANGKMEVQSSQMVRSTSSSIKLTDTEFNGLFGKAFMELQAFTYDKFPSLYNAASTREMERKEEQKKGSSTAS